MYDTLTVNNPHDREQVTWYFGIHDHFLKVRDFCRDNKLMFLTGNASALPDGEFDTDDQEFMDWFNEQAGMKAAAVPSVASDRLELLRQVVAARQDYWTALRALECALTSGGDFTDRQDAAAIDHIAALASGGRADSITAAELDGFLQAVFDQVPGHGLAIGAGIPDDRAAG